MLARKTALITSRDPKGRQAVSIFEAAYNHLNLNEGEAQVLNERGNKLKQGIEHLIHIIVMEQAPRVKERWRVRYPHSPHVAEVEIKEISAKVVRVKECGFGPFYTFKITEIEFLELCAW
ncbi:MAG: hypothetical protein UY97_C0001G0012 [Parcubacteria group bacterium GW2011_GWB1_57_6]|nr:MAG: hypothetical protein UY93_C0001G0063 [Parcubacteria group bacterium GW2011_GWA1_56_13]KKW46955.1 MAG: hypothetical protein UY97_C0001G0012 [Parcubacteria group bacterium GW2011_GWB1_57_6]